MIMPCVAIGASHFARKDFWTGTVLLAAGSSLGHSLLEEATPLGFNVWGKQADESSALLHFL